VALRRAAAVAAALAAALAGAPGAPAAGEPLAVSVSWRPARALFGDRVAAVAVVSADPAAVDPATIRAPGSFGALDALSAPEIERAEAGGRAVVRFRWQVSCLGEGCAPGARPRAVKVPPLRVVATTRGGGTVAVSAAWPALTVAGRVPASALAAAIPPFRAETGLPPPSYRLAPATLEWLLAAIAAALVAALAVPAGLALRGRARRRRAGRLAALPPLERALLLAREARRRGPPDRRRALGLLARVVGGPASGLGGPVSELAWGPGEPAPEQITAAVETVEREAERS
jgi:hypothetical protein